MQQALSIGGARLPLAMLCRHALIAGATGSGKTVTAAAMVEQMQAAGVPVLVLDAKGDLGALASPGRHIVPRVDLLRMGSDLVARALDLTGPQAGALEIALAFAEDSGLRVASLADLRGLLSSVMVQADEIGRRYGLLSLSSVAAVQRAILRLERGGAAGLFGRNAFDPFTCEGQGVTVLHCQPLADVPGLYGAAVAHWLDVLQREAEELGNVPRPALAVVIDESHLVFDDVPPGVLRIIERAARLVRSRGVSLIFASQSPADIPDGIAGQILTRIQHALRATTPQQMRAVRSAAESMRVPSEVIEGLPTGCALVRVPDAQGRLGAAEAQRVQRGRVDLVAVAPPKAAAVHFSDTQPLPVPPVHFSDVKPSKAKETGPKRFWRWRNPAAWCWGALAGFWGLALLGLLFPF